MNTLEKRTDSDLERLEDWTRLSEEARKQRIGRAINSFDRETFEDEEATEENAETVRDAFEAYVRHDSAAGLKASDHTVTAYRQALTRLIDFHGSLSVHKMSGSDAKRFRAHLQDTLSDKSVDTYITGARRALDAYEWFGYGTDRDNPFDGIGTTDKTSAGDKADPYSVEELNALLEEADTRDRALFLLAADGGLRLAEICELEWKDMDTVNEQIRIRGGKGRKDRTVEATDRLLEALNDWKDEKDGQEVISVSRRRLQQIMDQRCNRAGVRSRGIHNLRHTCGTRLYEETRDLQVVARHLGHSSTKTAEIYAHLADSDYTEAVKALDTNGVK